MNQRVINLELTLAELKTHSFGTAHTLVLYGRTPGNQGVKVNLSMDGDEYIGHIAEQFHKGIAARQRELDKARQRLRGEET